MPDGPPDAPPPPVLVVDDDEAIRQMVVETLESEGYRVVAAADGQEALAAARAQQPCLVLLDLWMPGMDGWAVARAYRAVGGTAPIVVMTAARDAEAAAAELGAIGYLAKPFDLDDLSAAVVRACAAG